MVFSRGLFYEWTLTPDVKMADEKVDNAQIADGVEDTVWLCAERGWRIHLTFKSGETVKGVFITATDQERKFIVVEPPGARQKKPRLVDLREIRRVEAVWGK